MTKCSVCRHDKDWREFRSSLNGEYLKTLSYCKECEKKRQHGYYLKRKEKDKLTQSFPPEFQDNNKERADYLREKRKEANLSKLQAKIKDWGCSRCQNKDPRVLSFIPDKSLVQQNGGKVKPLSSLLYYSWARIEMELHWYTDVLCLNCRAIKRSPVWAYGCGNGSWYQINIIFNVICFRYLYALNIIPRSAHIYVKNYLYFYCQK